MKKTNTFLIMLLFAFCVFSCSKEDDHSMEIEGTLTDSQNYSNSDLYKETSILVGKLLKDKKVRTEVLNNMAELDEYGELVSFSFLLNKETQKKNEIAALDNRPELKSSNSFFKIALEREFSANRKSYKLLNQELKEKGIKSSDDLPEELASFLSDENIQIYLPSRDTVYTKQVSDGDYYVSHATLDGSPTNDAYHFTEENPDDYIVEQDVNNDFIDENEVYIVSPIDECDLEGYDCGYNEMTASSEDELMVDPGYGGGGGGLPTIDGPELLTENVDYTAIPEEDIISSRIPRIRIRGNDWTGFGATHQKLRFYRASIEDDEDREIIQNTDGSITAPPQKFSVGGEFRTRTKNVRNENWVYFDNTEFDDDWNMSENTQSIAVFSIHHFASTAEATLTAEAGFELDDGEFEPTVEASGEVEISVSVGSAIFRANKEISRRQVLTANVGPNPSGKIYPEDKADFNVKSVGIIDFYFKHYYTDVSE